MSSVQLRPVARVTRPSPAEHALHASPHPPQLLVSVCSSTHAPEQHVPPEQAAPSAPVSQAVVVFAGWQVSHASLGFVAPDGYTNPPMKQPDTQLAPLHTWPVPQLVPSEDVVHAVVLVPGSQLWHVFVGFAAPLA